MAWPWLAIIAKNVPWVELARRAPDIWAKSRALLEESRRQGSSPAARGGATPEALRQRIEVLEQRDAEHARLLADMVEQLQGLTYVVQALRARNKLLSWLVAFSVLGLLALLFAVRTASGG